MNEAPAFGHSEYDGQTTLHPVVLCALILLGLAMLLLPRKYAVWPMIFMACFISPAQRIVIINLNFSILRLMVLFATVRILARREYAGIRPSTLDWVVLAYAASATVIYTLQQETFGAFIYRLGNSYDALGMYFTFRCLIRTWEDLHGLILGFIAASIPVTLCFLVELFTGRNIFAFEGGVSEITGIREGRVRCHGAFAHPILAGCFWATILPLMAARWFDPRKGKYLTLVGVGCCLAIIVLCASSTPIMAVTFALLAAGLFPLRRSMRKIRWGILATLVCLHMVMKGPVWSLVARVDILNGSTGWHRFLLIDGAIKHFGEWWLLGTKDTAHWANLEGVGLADITNQYILEGVQGGVLTLALFIALFALAFRNVGQLRYAEEVGGNRPGVILAWALGVMLFVHLTSFFGVSYFGQISMLIWLPLAVSASISQVRRSVQALTINGSVSGPMTAKALA